MSPELCGAGVPARETPETKAHRARAHTILATIISSIARSLAVLVAALREIFDEAAYHRFLDRSRLQSSTNAYAMFQQENEQAKSRKPRCC
jgi:hypothetical protein